ncbi:MAG: polysaccharide biosynthesis C-terminal domain-containing protein [Bacteroidetes bacterium]|nr:polysaccharide biosynthesis C-terminal domain-containing protein [Bacteroidota bacterium]
MATLKTVRRFQLIALNALSNMSSPIGSMICSWLVIRLISPELWGAYTKIILWFMLATQLTGFGNKEYLLREFSKNPKDIFPALKSAFLARSRVFLAAACIILFLPITIILKCILIGWLLARFVYSSFDPLLLFERKFSITLILESIAVLIFFLLIMNRPAEAGLSWLLIAFLGIEVFKASALVLLYKKQLFTFSPLTPAFPFYRGAGPFLLLSISGLISSRADLYLVSIYLDKYQIAQYSVLLNFLIYLQALSNYVFQPFMKNFYRIHSSGKKKITYRFIGLGILITLFGVPVVWWVTNNLFHLSFDANFIWLGMIYVLPIFLYLPVIYLLYKSGKEHVVLFLNLFGIVLNILLNMIWLPSLGMKGALLSAAVVQLSVALIYFFNTPKEKENDLLAVS